MFRNMRRFKQQISVEECKELLRNEKRGVLSVIGDDGYPYGIPLNHYYDEDANAIYFHGAKEGHKVDAIKKCDKVCYTVYEKGVKKEDHWSLNVRSVVIFGKASFINDLNECLEICKKLWTKFSGTYEELQKELENAGPRVMCMKVDIEHMTGKMVNES